MPESNTEFEQLINQALEDVQSFRGWDFSFLTNSRRMVNAPIKWSYQNEVQRHLEGIDTFLDIGTGGGEVMSQIRPLPKHSHAIEDYPPNIEAAKARLEPLGIKVTGIELKDEPPFYDELPFEDDYFDLAINRHISYTVNELYRIIRPDGYFVTQQVGGLTAVNLKLIIHGEKTTTIPNWNLKTAIEELIEGGFEVTDAKDEIGYTRFSDIGAIVYHLIACPWTVEDFTVEKYRDKLLYLHNYIQRNGYYDMLFESLLMVARKPD